MTPFLVITFLLLALEHYFPLDTLWRHVFKGEKHVTYNYVLGVLGIIAPLIWWVLSETPRTYDIVVGLIAFPVVAGVTVKGAYMVDGWMHLKDKVAEQDERITLLERQKDAKTKGS